MTKSNVLATNTIVAAPLKAKTLDNDRWMIGPFRFVRRFFVIASLPLVGLLLVATMIDLSAYDISFVGLAESPVQREWFLVLNSGAQTLPTGVWQSLSMLGNGVVVLLLLSPLLGYYPKVWWSVLACAPFAGAFSMLGKHWAAVPRPAAVLDQATFTIIGDPLVGANSFPSGHSITIFAGVTAVLMTLRLRSLRRQLQLIAGGLVFAGIVSFSRVAVGAHWPLDLLAGAFLGSVSALLGVLVAGWIANQKSRISGRVTSYASAALLIVLSVSIARESFAESYSAIVLTLAAGNGLVVATWLCRNNENIEK